MNDEWREVWCYDTYFRSIKIGIGIAIAIVDYVDVKHTADQLSAGAVSSV